MGAQNCTIFCILLYIMRMPLGLLNLARFCIIIYKCTKLVLLELFVLSLIKIKHLCLLQHHLIIYQYTILTCVYLIRILQTHSRTILGTASHFPLNTDSSYVNDGKLFPGPAVFIILKLNLCMFSERELTVCYRPSVCRLPVCLSVTYVRPTQPVKIFGNVSLPFGTLATR